MTIKSDDRVLRLRCLELAATPSIEKEVAISVVARAAIYSEFVVSGLQRVTPPGVVSTVPMPKRPYTRRAHADNLHIVRKPTKPAAKRTPKKK